MENINIEKKCICCELELFIDNFRKTKRGNHTDTCNGCITNFRRQRKKEKIKGLNTHGKEYDVWFEGKAPREVIEIMGRAKNGQSTGDMKLL